MRSIKRYRFKQLLEELASKRGRGTELISVYITPDFDLNKVVQQLREEQGTASNIKSKSTRKNVIAALERIIQFLRSYIETHRRPPPNGLAIFCGNVAGREDVADIQLYWLEPPEPITVRMYRCNQQFVLEPLREMLEVRETVGLVVLDRREATIATLRGKHVEILHTLTSGVPGKHKHGGQSQRRFERLIEIAAFEFMKRIAEAVNELFSRVPDLRTIIVGGPGPTKDEFLKAELLRDDLRRKVGAVVDTGYTDEQGIKELVNKSGEVLAGLEIMEEKRAVQRFLQELVRDEGKAVYGEAEVRRALEQGAAELLLISEALRLIKVRARCQACGHELEERARSLEFYQRQLPNKPCPSCGELKLQLVEHRDVVQELGELAERFGARVEFVSRETEEGQQLWSAFKGLAAVLRFKPSA